MYKYTAYVNDDTIIDHNDFKEILKDCIVDGIFSIQHYGWSKIIHIYNNYTGSYYSLFFNARDSYDFDTSKVRIIRHMYSKAFSKNNNYFRDIKSIPVRNFCVSEIHN